jgi:hypothetical protein
MLESRVCCADARSGSRSRRGTAQVICAHAVSEGGRGRRRAFLRSDAPRRRVPRSACAPPELRRRTIVPDLTAGGCKLADIKRIVFSHFAVGPGATLCTAAGRPPYSDDSPDWPAPPLALGAAHPRRPPRPRLAHPSEAVVALDATAADLTDVLTVTRRVTYLFFESITGPRIWDDLTPRIADRVLDGGTVADRSQAPQRIAPRVVPMPMRVPVPVRAPPPEEPSAPLPRPLDLARPVGVAAPNTRETRSTSAAPLHRPGRHVWQCGPTMRPRESTSSIRPD